MATNLVEVRLLADYEIAVDSPGRPDQALIVQRRIVGTVEFLQLIAKVGEARLETQAEPVQDSEVGLVDAVHVAGDRGRHDVRRVAIPDVEHVMGLVIVRADQVAVERHVVAQQRVGDHALAAPKVFARVARFHGRPLDAEFLTIDGTVQCRGGGGGGIEVERVVREDRQRGDGVADAVVGRVQRCVAQVLLVGALQHVVRDVAGACHDLVAVVHRLRDDDRHQAVGVGDLLRIARLQRRQRRQELALAVDEAEHVGHVAERQLLVERLLARLLVLALGLAPCQLLRVLVVFQVRQLALLQLAVEGQPLSAQLGRERIELGIEWLPQERDVDLRQHGGLLIQRNQLVGKMPVLQAVVEVEFTDWKRFLTWRYSQNS